MSVKPVLTCLVKTSRGSFPRRASTAVFPVSPPPRPSSRPPQPQSLLLRRMPVTITEEFVDGDHTFTSLFVDFGTSIAEPDTTSISSTTSDPTTTTTTSSFHNLTSHTSFVGFPPTASGVEPSESVVSATYGFGNASSGWSYSDGTDGSSGHGRVVAAAVGGSMGALLAVLIGGVFLCLHRRRKQRAAGGAWQTFPKDQEPPANTELERRFAALEAEVRSLRAEVARISTSTAREGSSSRASRGLVSRGPSLMYTHEKSLDALRDPTRPRRIEEKDGPPTYV
ncbi:hypothetical protein C8F01DRAFT_1134448, partial [Mycena amicta]